MVCPVDVDGESSSSFLTVTVRKTLLPPPLPVAPDLLPPVPPGTNISILINFLTKNEKFDFEPLVFDVDVADGVLRSFFAPGFEKCLSSKWRRKFRDCRMTAPQIGHEAGCSDWERDFGSESELERRGDFDSLKENHLKNVDFG